MEGLDRNKVEKTSISDHSFFRLSLHIRDGGLKFILKGFGLADSSYTTQPWQSFTIIST